MIRIHIGSILENGLDLVQTIAADRLPLLNEIPGEDRVVFNRPIQARIHATRFGDTVSIRGTLSAQARISCCRCLKPFDLPIETEFTATAIPRKETPSGTEEKEEIELTPEEMDVIHYSGDHIELGEEVAQQIIMDIPIKPLCRETCKGLCSRCGTDLNISTCQCDQKRKDSPFAALRTFSFPNKPK